jgi:dTDP-glucose 4,6-dehydratase
MKVLVTGGMGFIGSNFVRYMLSTRSDVEVINLDDLSLGSNPANLKDLKKDRRYRFIKGSIAGVKLISKLIEKADAVVNCAAQTHVDRSIANPDPFMESNVMGTYSILEGVRKRNPTAKIIHVSTDEIYGDILEGSYKEDDRLKPSNPYCLPADAGVLLENGKEINIEDMVEAKKVVSLLSAMVKRSQLPSSPWDLRKESIVATW